MSRSLVRRLCAGLDEQVRIFRKRPLEGAYPYLWLDARVEKLRERGGVRPKTLVIAQGVHESGHREIIGIDAGQRCTVHFLRDKLGHCAKAQQPLVAGAIRQVFAAESSAEAHARLAEVTVALTQSAPKVARLLADAEEELLPFMALPRRALVQATLHEPPGARQP